MNFRFPYNVGDSLTSQGTKSVCTCVVVNIKNERDNIIANPRHDNVRFKRKILVNLNLNIVLFFFSIEGSKFNVSLNVNTMSATC